MTRETEAVKDRDNGKGKERERDKGKGVTNHRNLNESKGGVGSGGKK